MGLVQGNTTEEKLLCMEKILLSFQKRLTTKVIGFTPPIPICSSKYKLENDGNLLRIMLPFGGSVPLALTYVEKFLQKSPILTVTYSTSSASSTVKIELNDKIQKYSLDWQIEAASLIEVFVIPFDAVENVHVAMALYPEMDRSRKEEFLISELLKLNEIELKEILNERV